MNIATITLNPAIDTIYHVDHWVEGSINRIRSHLRCAGGKGINVAKVLRTLGADVSCLGFIGGHHGRLLADLMQQRSLINQMTSIRAETRICINILSQHHTELLEQGPSIMDHEVEQFIQQLNAILQDKQLKIVVISGSLPASLPKDFYSTIIDLIKKQGVSVLLDSSGSSLWSTYNTPPMVLKVNESEWMEYKEHLSWNDETLEDSLLRMKSIPIILITQGKDGAIAKWYQEIYHIHHDPQSQIINATGSGDSVSAGLAFGIAQDLPVEEILQLAIACGIDNTQHLEAGTITPKTVEELKSSITISRIYS
ncbi:1-phosphofructokinase family hexose kinase (plasmid) [Entomospira nematocerorum]|uniref:1-phosphofructokinase family hexose kinase n=1 Tax=Entomospira nematocerorum TaxID=2719987 RepID=A0A968GD98_9SPIO|nr:1-phosphofructokinase family hexose kinase [Entomospira nematocera]NIZ47705.1 1-phosphofructokinase family hexose kinase [Entomospira nematocera]WDI34680.1 1-phosphofructokinase family hexose kinase [Entomospira nematocera]